MIKLACFCSLLFLCLAGCTSSKKTADLSTSLPEARRSFKTALLPQTAGKEPVEPAPPRLLQTIKYPAESGALAAYLSPNPGDGRKHPVIIWIVGGDCNSIGDVWSPAPRDNDQTAAAFRQAGIVMMFPSLRGGNDNPGAKEGFLGEVNDVLAAAKYLEKLDYVNPRRIYLGGHSTGGTLVLLVAESTDRFRAVFSFGPVEDVSGYGMKSKLLPFDVSNDKEVALRSPGYWLHSIQSPIWVLEGVEGNIDSLRALAEASHNPKAHFIEIQRADHFTTLAPTNELIATKILQDTGEVNNISITESEVNRLFAK